MPTSKNRKGKARKTQTRRTPQGVKGWNRSRAARDVARAHGDLINWLTPRDATDPAALLMRDEISAAITSHAHLGAEALALNLHCNLGLNVTKEQVADPEENLPQIIDEWIATRGAGLEAADLITTSPEAAEVIMAAADALTGNDVLTIANDKGGVFGHGYLHLPEAITYRVAVDPEESARVILDPHPAGIETLGAVACMDGVVTPRTIDGVVGEGAVTVPRLLTFSPVEDSSPSRHVQAYIRRVNTYGATVPGMKLSQEGWIGTSEAITDLGAPTLEEGDGLRRGVYQRSVPVDGTTEPLASRVLAAMYQLVGQGVLTAEQVRTSPQTARDKGRDVWPPVTVLTVPHPEGFRREDRLPAHSAWGRDGRWQVVVSGRVQDGQVVFDSPEFVRVED